MKSLIVHAHAEPKSFNGALTRHAKEVLEAPGHEVIISDLYAMRFDPVSDRLLFSNRLRRTFPVKAVRTSSHKLN